MSETTPPRGEIWFRRIYADLVLNRHVTTIFRPGKRLNGDPKGFQEGEILRVRIIEKVGAEWAGVFGRVCPDIEIPVQVHEVKASRIVELEPSDFEGSTPDVADAQSLIYQLGILYNLSPSEIGPNSIVTKTTFAYL